MKFSSSIIASTVLVVIPTVSALNILHDTHQLSNRAHVDVLKSRNFNDHPMHNKRACSNKNLQRNLAHYSSGNSDDSSNLQAPIEGILLSSSSATQSSSVNAPPKVAQNQGQKQGNAAIQAPAPAVPTIGPPAAPSPPPAPSPSPPLAPAAPAPQAQAVYGSKKGFGLNNPEWVQVSPLNNRIGWAYTWSPWCPDSYKNNGIECVPMCWGRNQVSEFRGKLAGYKASGVKYLLGFNEPEQTGQSHMSVEEAASLWLSTFADQKGQFGLVGPALTASDENTQWQVQFMRLVASAPPDYMALHYYGLDSQGMIDYLNKFHNTFPDKQIWVTEYACQDFWQNKPCPHVYGFNSRVQDFMANTPWIARYAAFGYLSDMANVNYLNQMVLPNGSGPSNLGQAYLNHW